ncbi:MULTISPECIES: LuxR family transcriptional regulator [Brenneria]|uniref:LuxR family transcriptional regulator n=1 Tax=Brenneria nigrifluens DSM 30175 = ATCC 13028 TaxID=1121120 RepID=A0A2U1UJZ0_9GAMM|nr:MULTISPECIES: LuxR family transcriptional regulator [Brenneria]EHD20943.1 transcriptional regulator, LuxR family [Brenneria sp. EniD312]PWC21999.1 LuxR family transcriptional regulator [Brenneria nigrifluens DSM 30175 = ATCC 13028]QCR04103.1 LuxR family transcriptional regulator [Brenneria nigrifluens DSM 30175 = ATCC 13028]
MKRVVKENGARPQQATLDAAFERLYGQTSRLGFDALIYDYTPVPRSVEGELITPSVLQMRNVPEDMQLLWCESGYYQVDPVQIYALESCAPFIWSYQRPDSSSLRNIIDERHYPVTHYMRDNNMPCGATVPLHLPRGGFVTVTGIHSGAGHERDIDQVLAELSLLAHTFQEQIYPLFDDRVLTCQHIRLSKRERECLAWAAEGLTAKEIARKLNRSIATVALHLNSAARKLGASNRVQAVVRALHYRLLDS